VNREAIRLVEPEGHREALLDEALIQTFPASDPVSTLAPTAEETHP
jgi:hypothetical protein